MRCPFCNGVDTSVKNSRPSDCRMSVRRRRSCDTCGSRFATVEELLLKPVKVLKKDGRVEAFDRQKLLTSIALATKKRPVTRDQINTVVSNMFYKLEAVRGSVVSSRMIGEMVMETLFALDKISYIRFASVYMNFSDVNDFSGIVERVQEVV
ncbi:transcriptional regulator NrdR [Anaplasma capra]|uniref:transcriptional regulator NrdR n=1 Tax=Anaplasma capra TaxID=1562740 RepID=UPI0021D5BC69|nr:transcriptional regulator NrdR [Anaplasma capra]MCU7611258.1 transcriptional regulator NrdR [Anaplasma capra]MCU7612685.1 transcriptional regulator NrdR [Anaplasma capra]